MRSTLLLVALAAVPIWADPVRDARRAIQTEYDRANQAYVRKDLEKSLAAHAPEFYFTQVTGERIYRPELKISRKAVFQRCSKLIASSKITGIQLDGKKAVMQVQEKWGWTGPGFWPGSKKLYKSEDTAQDTWVKTARGWKMTSSANLTQTDSDSNKTKSRQVGYLRIIRDTQSNPISLDAEIARFRKGDRTVDLVAALHVGEQSYYQQLNQEFKTYDAVLYELIAPEDMRPQAEDESDNALTDGQMLLTKMLGLKFQLREIDYKARNFVHADLTPEQLFASMDKRGESAKQMIFQMLQESMGSSTDIDPADALALNVALPRIMLKGARPGDRALLRRVFAQSFQKMEKVTAALSGPNGSTLINVRNGRALEVMQRELARGRKRVAIFYGAGHMVDLEARLKKMGFQPQSVRYLKAWDLREPKNK